MPSPYSYEGTPSGALGRAEQWISTWDVWQRLETLLVVTIQVFHWHLLGAD